MSNRVTDQYLKSATLARAGREIVLPPAYAESYEGALLDRPMFAAESEIATFADDLASLFGLLVSLPERLFDGDLERYCAAIGMDPRLSRLMRRGGDVAPPMYARADAYHDGTAFRLLEFNVGSELGGIDAAQINRAYLNVPAFNGFRRRHRLGYLDTSVRVADALRTAATAVTGGGDAVVALIESPGGIAGHESLFMAMREAMRINGIELLLGEIHQLRERNGKLVLRDVPLDVVLRYFVVGELVDHPAGLEAVDRVLSADKTVLFTPLSSGMFASKGSLGLMHDPRTRASYTAAEAALVDRIVPWTRSLSRAGDRDELVERCRAQRETLVLKPGVGYGGVGAVVGHAVSDERWRTALAEAAGTDHVVQRLVRAVPEEVVNPDTGGVEQWITNWGVFVDNAGYAGSFGRALKVHDGPVVSGGHGARTTCVFTDPGAP